jgi:ankyrin repeat protein
MSFSVKSQFSSDLTLPNPDTEYYCSKLTKCKGWTLLHKLVFFPDLLQDYLSRNPRVDINVKNIKRWSPLALACRNSNTDSNVETVKLLLDNGADVNSKQDDGWTPLTLACRYSNTDSNVQTVKLLLDNGADVNLKNNVGWTPLMSACRYSNATSNVETVQLLLDNGADVNSKTVNGWTPLASACRNSNTDSNVQTVQLLLDRGADVNSKTNDGWTPLELACILGDTETIKLLLDNGAKPEKFQTKAKICDILLEEREIFKYKGCDSMYNNPVRKNKARFNYT